MEATFGSRLEIGGAKVEDIFYAGSFSIGYRGGGNVEVAIG